ncbi:hypothetical protein PIIN_00521 [Serendipita indica DSM 11827]|uniref:lipoyl(octanoyl) transferase n=1 Tax=Serendipita indica (strain DSM 11827) TaxID=1109443 RepID=G4U2P6_SERID|nr:hypothetical protein PIIN_00521 [Serendipita indica DSM 11827]
MSLRPVLYHIFPKPLPYLPALALQEKIHSIQARSRTTSSTGEKEATQSSLSGSKHPDILLLLEHRPVYTAGRRQDAVALDEERKRLVRSGAEWVATQRGGETTYHGPGQIVGYPLFDLTRMGIRTREHVCRTQTLLKDYLRDRHNVPSFESTHTGVFVSETEKVASIGMQVRHGLTSHGFAINITDEPLRWFDQVVACGLADVRAASAESARAQFTGKRVPLNIREECEVLRDMFGEVYHMPVKSLDEAEVEIWQAVKEVEAVAEQAGEWPREPIQT